MVRDVGVAEDLAQEALVAALETWPRTGVPDNPGAWLMATAKNRAVDLSRRATTYERKREEIAHELGLMMAMEGASPASGSLGGPASRQRSRPSRRLNCRPGSIDRISAAIAIWNTNPPDAENPDTATSPVGGSRRDGRQDDCQQDHCQQSHWQRDSQQK